MEIHMVENRQKGITKAYRNDKKDNDTRLHIPVFRGSASIVLPTIVWYMFFYKFISYVASYVGPIQTGFRRG